MFDIVYWFTFLGTFIYSYVLFCCYNKTLDKSQKLGLYEWIIIIVISLIITTNNLYNNVNFMMPCSFIIMFGFYYLIFKEKNLKYIYKVFFIYSISIITDLLLLIGLSFIVSNYEILNMHYGLKFVYSIISSIFLFFAFRSKIISWVYRKLAYILTNNRKTIIIAIIIFLIASFCYFLYNQDYSNISFYIISLIWLGTMGWSIFYYFKQSYNNKLLELNNKYLEENLELFKHALDQYRELKHNIMNDFIFIKSITHSETHKLIDTKMEKYSNEYTIIDNIENVPSGLQGLIYVKARMAKKDKIEFSFNATSNYDYGKPGSYKLYVDVCEALCVVLDNAIEAAREANPKVVFVNVFSSKEGFNIEVINTFSNDIDLDRIGDKNYSTKNRGSGIGLDYIKRLNKNIKIEKEIIHNLFKIIIKIKNKA